MDFSYLPFRIILIITRYFFEKVIDSGSKSITGNETSPLKIKEFFGTFRKDPTRTIFKIYRSFVIKNRFSYIKISFMDLIYKDVNSVRVLTPHIVCFKVFTIVKNKESFLTDDDSFSDKVIPLNRKYTYNLNSWVLNTVADCLRYSGNEKRIVYLQTHSLIDREWLKGIKLNFLELCVMYETRKLYKYINKSCKELKLFFVNYPWHGRGFNSYILKVLNELTTDSNVRSIFIELNEKCSTNLVEFQQIKGVKVHLCMKEVPIISF